MSLSDKLKNKGVQETRDPKWASDPTILLCPQIPAPMHGVAPRLVLGTKWWDETHKQAYAKSGFCCWACGVPKDRAKGVQYLEGHEVYDFQYQLGQMIYLHTVALCNYCHSFIHQGRLAGLLEKGKIKRSKVKAIIDHGDEVLKRANLVKPLPYSGPMASWSQWRLIIDIPMPDGSHHQSATLPHFKSLQEWQEFYLIEGEE